ncbi:transposase [Tessaracoccus sp. MC1627]|nr:transposase [Tessaracoccus sp. MC1627]
MTHSEKELAAPTFKRSFGYHPIGVWCDNTGEFLAAALRTGRAGSNTAVDHIQVLGEAITQIPMPLSPPSVDPLRLGRRLPPVAGLAHCTRPSQRPQPGLQRGVHDRREGASRDHRTSRGLVVAGAEGRG